MSVHGDPALLDTARPDEVVEVERRAGFRRPRSIRIGAVARRRLVTYVPPLLVALLALPFILWQNAWWEWQNAFWLLERQTEHVAAHGTPTFFLHTADGTFYPYHMLYAGPTVAVLAYPAALIGAWPVFAASVVIALVASYLGIWWTARNLGVSRGLAVLPALTFTTAPYMLTDLYGRTAWAELVAVNAAAVMLGAITSLIWRPDRARGRSWAALVVASVFVAGTHNLTVLMAGVLLPLFLVALVPTLPRPVRARHLARSTGGVVLAAALGAGLTGIWLVPNLWYGPQTAIAEPRVFLLGIEHLAVFLKPTNVLSPWPALPPGARGNYWLYVQPPVLALGWALVALAVMAVARRRASRRSLLSALLLAGMGATLLVLIMVPSLWAHAPTVAQVIQTPIRLVSYVGMATALVLALALTSLAAGRARTWLVRALIVIVVVQAGMAVYIAKTTTATAPFPTTLFRHGGVPAKSEPTSFASTGLVNALQFRVVDKAFGPPEFAADPYALAMSDPLTSDVATIKTTGKRGLAAPITAIWSPFIRVDGDAKLVGRTPNGLAIVRITQTDAKGRWSATVRPVCSGLCLAGLQGDAPWQLTAGRFLSLFCALALAAIGGLRLRHWLRAR
jgi:hypothetical protein